VGLDLRDDSKVPPIESQDLGERGGMLTRSFSFNPYRLLLFLKCFVSMDCTYTPTIVQTTGFNPKRIADRKTNKNTSNAVLNLTSMLALF
jgi:hypothetical protein